MQTTHTRMYCWQISNKLSHLIYHIKIKNKWKMEVTFVVECTLVEVISIEIYHRFGWLQFHSISLMGFHFFQFSLLRRTYNIPFPMNDNYLVLLQRHLIHNIFGFQYLSQMWFSLQLCCEEINTLSNRYNYHQEKSSTFSSFTT